MANRFLSNITINDEYTLPNADGDANQIIQTDGAGNLSFVDLSSIDGAASNFTYFEVKNETGATINKGKGVMAVGTDGNSGHILIDEMVADGSVEPKYFLGVLETTVANGGFARVISFGQLDQFNTNGQNGETWNDGNILWCDPDSDGDFTITEPLGPNVKIAAAIVLNASTNGKIQVRVQANEGVHDLHDTKITSQTDGDVLVWNNTEKVWFNDSTLNVDYTNGRVGIGTTPPSYTLDVNGNTGIRITTPSDLPLRAISTDGFSAIEIADNTHSYYVGTTSDDFIIRSATDGNIDRLTIQGSTGNVGIGTTSPSQKLDVVGKISINDGGQSVYVGYNAGLNDDATDNRNVGVGHLSLYTNTSGYFNTGTGYNSLRLNTTGYYNSAFGYASLYRNTTGYANAASGPLALYNNTDGNNNTATGYQALYANQTGDKNTAHGAQALFQSTTSGNTAFGHRASYGNTTGINNSSFGAFALNSMSTGNYNTGLGSSSMLLSTSGNFNTAVGYQTLYYTSGSENATLGYKAGFAIASGAGNTSSNKSVFIGADSRPNAVGEENQIAIGYQAIGLGSNTVVLGNNNITTTALKGNVGIGTTSPGSKLEVNGTFNVNSIGDRVIIADPSNGSFSLGDLDGLGDEAQIVGDGNTIKINNAGNNTLTSTFNNRIGIGTTNPFYKLDVDGDGRFKGDVRADSFILNSDAEFKDNIKDIPVAKSKIRFKEYTLKSDTSGKKKYGVIADDIINDYPELVHYNEEGLAGVDYISLLVKKVAELESEISLLNKRLDAARIK